MAQDAAYIRLALRIFAEISAAILFPALLALAIGRFAGPTGLSRPAQIALFALAFALTAVLIVRRARTFGRDYEALGKVPPLDHL